MSVPRLHVHHVSLSNDLTHAVPDEYHFRVLLLDHKRIDGFTNCTTDFVKCRSRSKRTRVVDPVDIRLFAHFRVSAKSGGPIELSLLVKPGTPGACKPMEENDCYP